MYVVHVVQGVHTKVGQQVAPARAHVPVQRAGYSKDLHSNNGSRSSFFSIKVEVPQPKVR